MAQALYFGSGEQQLFGLLHHSPRSHATATGLVLCNPFGYESICAHRSIRAFAEAAASIGVPSLRFDYRGTGDSADLDPDADQVEAWSKDVREAVAELRQQTGVERVCLLGFRMGAMLAALAARTCNDVCGLMVVAPVVSGRRYVREMRTMRLAAMIGSDDRQGSKAMARENLFAEPPPLEVSGFLLSSATVAALGQIDLCAVADTPAAYVSVIDSDSLPAARAWAELLAKSGADLTYQALPGIVEMLMTAPQFAVVPKHIIAAMREWLSSFIPIPPACTDPRKSLDIGGRMEFPEAVMTLRASDYRHSATLTERPVLFGPDATLFGILTEPPRDDARRCAVILLNPGVDHHIGASRLYVSFARQWSGRGCFVLRMDLGGIGDSGTRPGKQDDDAFPSSALDDIRAAISYLRGKYHVGEISLVGLCSGAYHALRAAAAGIQVQRIIMINPQNYFWDESMSLEDLQLVEVVRNPGIYRHKVLSAAAWSRVVRGQVNLSRIALIFIQRMQLAAVTSLRNLARHLHLPLARDLGRDLEEIAARGVAIIFVFARDEPGLDLLKLEGGKTVSRLGNRCRVHVLERGDHVFSHFDSRSALEDVLCHELFEKSALEPT